MTKKVAIVQSNYIPWKGYFDLINMVDEFILFDDMQYTRRDWRNRNKIKTVSGTQWLTIPVRVKGRYHQKICDTVTSVPNWAQKHWKTIQLNYSKASYFKEYHELFEELYLGHNKTHLSAINYRFLVAICKVLDINTQISWSMDYEIAEGKTARLVSLAKQANATTYVSGPSASNYIAPELFAQEGIDLVYMSYTGYPEYQQLFPPFEHGVSVIDLIFNHGNHAKKYMLSF
jgi:hypothetical protein